MKHLSTIFLFLLAVTLSFTCQLSQTHAAISFSGNVEPTNSSDWNSSTAGYVGKTAAGTLTLTDGNLISSAGYIGYSNGAIGMMTVSGTGSMWCTSNSILNVGHDGAGLLNIVNGGCVSNSFGSIGHNSGSIGAVSVSGTGSTWTNTGYIFIGNYGFGALNIASGGTVCSDGSLLANRSDSMGIVAVNGAGSTWINSDCLQVGVYGHAMLVVDGGGAISSIGGIIGYYSGAMGIATVKGTGSTWTTNNYPIYIGPNGGSGSFHIRGGGVVASDSLFIGNSSLLTIDGGCNSSFVVRQGTGTISNSGTIRFLAGAGVPYDGIAYTPISAKTWHDTGTLQAVGGTLNTTNHKFTASAVELGTSGSSVSMNLAQKQRVLINGGTTGWTLGASFLHKTASTPLDFTATTICGGTLTVLEDLLDSNRSVGGAWSFATDGGYAEGEPAYLSFGIGVGHELDALQVWQYSDTGWSLFDAFDLTYDGNYASFTVTDLRGYAVAVPEPTMLFLLLGLGLGLLVKLARRVR